MARWWLVVLVVLSALLAACGGWSTPDGVVRTFMDALNARDEEKMLSVVSPSQRETALEYFPRPASTCNYETMTTIVRDAPEDKEMREVMLVGTVRCPKSNPAAFQFTFVMERLSGTWHIREIR